MRSNLSEQVSKLVGSLSEAVDSVDWSDKRIYAAYMAQTYHYVCHSTRLLAIAGGLMPLDQETAHRRFAKHIAEEDNHQKLAAHDVKALGFTLAEFPELETTKALYQVQYYHIEHINPWALMGYILILESLAVVKGEDLLKTVSRLHGEKATTFLRVHSSEDVEHSEKALELVESLPQKDIDAVRANLSLSCQLYSQMLRDLPLSAHASAGNKAKQAA